jgi:hypothetical protein
MDAYGMGKVMQIYTYGLIVLGVFVGLLVGAGVVFLWK